MTEDEIDALAVKFAAKVTAGLVEILGQHEDDMHQDRDTSISWAGNYSIDIKEAVADLIRALEP